MTRDEITKMDEAMAMPIRVPGLDTDLIRVNEQVMVDDPMCGTWNDDDEWSGQIDPNMCTNCENHYSLCICGEPRNYGF